MNTFKVACLGLMLMLQASQAAKILLYPFATGFNSRWMNMQKMGNMLLGQGHEVHMIVPYVYNHHFPSIHPDIELLEYPLPGNTSLINDAAFVNRMMEVSLYEFAEMMLRQQVNFCDSLLKERTLLDQLKSEHYDLFIIDYLDNCGRILIDYVDVPAMLYSNFGFSIESDIFLPVPLAYAPHPLSPYSDQMNFLQRVRNVVDYSLSILMYKFYYLKPFQNLRLKHGLNTSLSVDNSYHRASLTMCNTDFALDFPRPLMPNVITVGGLFYKQANPLDADLQTFIDGSGAHGIIVVSFGSLLSQMPEEKAEIFASVFAKLKQRVVWRYDGPRPKGLGENTMTLPWLPQNDLLGNKKTKLFVTHCGISSVHETINHAVPVVAVPLFTDQFYQAQKLIGRAKMGIKIDYTSLSRKELEKAIKTVLENKIYKENARHQSMLIKDQPISAKDKFFYYVNYLIRHGNADHLKPKVALSLKWYEYFLLDVFLFLIFVFVFIFGLFVMAWRHFKKLLKKCVAMPSDSLEWQKKCMSLLSLTFCAYVIYRIQI